VGAFSHKFSIAPSGETADRIKKVRGMQKRNGPPLSPCRLQTRKCDVSFVCLFFVTLWNDEFYDNGNAMKQYNFQNNYGVIAWRKVCSCASMFKFSYRPPEFFPRGKFLPKITIFGDFWGRKATFLSYSGEI